MAVIEIDTRKVGTGYPVFFIAEAGINHQGSVEIARKMIDVASQSATNAVKFQKRNNQKLFTSKNYHAPYFGPNAFGRTYGEHREILEFSKPQYQELKAYSESRSLTFLASTWDEDSADFLDELGVSAFKIPSADLRNTPLLHHVAKKNKPVMLSAGMSELEDIDRAYEVVRQFNPQVVIMQCTSTYPSRFDEINLSVIPMLAKRYPDAVIGYSGHELGIAISLAAVVLGAKVIERHFTLDRTMKGSDHAASLEPEGLRKLIRDIRNFESALGHPEKKILEREMPIRDKLAKSIVAKCIIPKGTKLSADLFEFKCPGTGLPPYRLAEFMGKKATVDIALEAQLRPEMVE